MDPAPTTRSQWAEGRLREAILTGELAPGERVLVDRLAASWSVSATPLREALRTLAGDGLIVLSPQRGARVSGFSPSEIHEVYELRLLLEPHALRLSLRARDDAWRGAVDAAWAALRDAWKASALPGDLEPAHTAFHLALVRDCGSASLLDTIGRLTTRSLRFRVLSASGRRGGSEQAYAEHAALYEACSGGDIDDAVRRCAAHIGSTVLAVLGAEALELLAERTAGGDPLIRAGLDGLAG